jgi:hypothetical protein
MSRICAKSWILVAFVVSIGGHQTASAGGIYGGTIDAAFSNPVFQGSYLNTAGNPVYLDTTSTAVDFIVNNGNSAEIIFGEMLRAVVLPARSIFSAAHSSIRRVTRNSTSGLSRTRTARARSRR